MFLHVGIRTVTFPSYRGPDKCVLRSWIQAFPRDRSKSQSLVTNARGKFAMQLLAAFYGNGISAPTPCAMPLPQAL